MFSEAKFVAPVVCTECGNNAHCVRRQETFGKEVQTFECAVCGHQTVLTREYGPSDEEVQRMAERVSGIGSRDEKPQEAVDQRRRGDAP